MGRRKKGTRVEDYGDISEMMVKCANGTPESVRALGDYIETMLKSRFGKILEIYLRGKEGEVLIRAKNDLGNSSFYLGMLGAVKEFWADLEQMVFDRDNLLQKNLQSVEEEI